MVHRYFPSLMDLSTDRLAFEVPVPSAAPVIGQRINSPHAVHVEEWAKVQDEAWAGFERSAPARIRVVVVDTPKDIRRREFGLSYPYSCIIIAWSILVPRR